MVSTARGLWAKRRAVLWSRAAFGMTHDHPDIRCVLGVHVAIGVAAGLAALGTAR